jgi:hypothetical protein
MTTSPRRRRHFAAAASHICVTAATPYFFGKLQFITYRSDEMPFLLCDNYSKTYKLLNPLAHALIGNGGSTGGGGAFGLKPITATEASTKITKGLGGYTERHRTVLKPHIGRYTHLMTDQLC